MKRKEDLYSSFVLTTIKWVLTPGKEKDIKKILKLYKDDFLGDLFLKSEVK